jgi:hypothetical protein
MPRITLSSAEGKRTPSPRVAMSAYSAIRSAARSAPHRRTLDDCSDVLRSRPPQADRRAPARHAIAVSPRAVRVILPGAKPLGSASHRSPKVLVDPSPWTQTVRCGPVFADGVESPFHDAGAVSPAALTSEPAVNVLHVVSSARTCYKDAYAADRALAKHWLPRLQGDGYPGAVTPAQRQADARFNDALSSG